MLNALGKNKSLVIVLAIILTAALLAADIWLGRILGWAVSTIVAAALLALLGWGAALFWRAAYRARLRERDRQAQADQQAMESWRGRLLDAEQRRAENERRLKMVLNLHHQMAEARDERSLMDAALSSVTGLVGALGCSFVPVDEWEQPLPAFTYGQLPEPVLSAWSQHLASTMLRERCGNCHILKSTPGACPLHPQEVGNTLTVYCLPLTGGSPNGVSADQAETLETPVRSSETGRTLGVMHLYLPSGFSLDVDTRLFLDDLLREIATAYDAARIRAQEQATLRQLKMLHAPESDFTLSLSGLLDGLAEALEADFVILRLRPSTDERFSNLNVQCGHPYTLEKDALEQLVERVLSAAAQGQSSASEQGALPVWQALPLTPPSLPESSGSAGPAPTLGVLLVGADTPRAYHTRQLAILQTVAAQAALLLENERLLRSLEYKVVIQERARLAREIHDGLAQTLAFLKLQAAQMQSYLAQGDLTRLSRVLKDNYQALTEAYLDTRQAIDDLRLTPQQGLEHWLERLLAEFENATGLTVERSIQPLVRPLAPEVQAQLIRIVQEALSNIRKHARARTVRLSLSERQGLQVLEVSDDGLGFASEDVPEISRHGLRGMRERAEMIGAEFQIISQARKGTIVRLALPVSLEEEPSQ